MKKIKNIYKSKEFAEAWDKRLLEEDLLRTKVMYPVLFKNLNLKNKKVLDVGCGNGVMLPELVKRGPSKVSAFDISKYLVGIARKRNPSVDFSIQDLTKSLKFRSNEFDVVFCFNVLMEFTNVANAIFELKRIVKRKGEIRLVLAHPLYNLFVNDPAVSKQSTAERLQRYRLNESFNVTTIPGYSDFKVYRRPISFYVNHFINAGLTIKHMQEIYVSKAVAKSREKYKKRLNFPMFLYFVLEK